MGFEDADDRPIDVLHAQAELAVVLVLAGQDPAAAVGLPYAVGYSFSGAPVCDVLLCHGHRVKGHADARWLVA